ncbi:hypothetical protein [Streptomyces sp. NPDC001774]
MASLAAIRAALTATLNGIPELRGYDSVPQTVNLPAAVVQPVEIEFDKAFARGTDQYELDVFVLVSGVDWKRAQVQLDSFLAAAGASSIREAVYQHADLGLADGTDAHVRSVKAYGADYKVGNVQLVGAVMRVRVCSPGTS